MTQESLQVWLVRWDSDNGVGGQGVGGQGVGGQGVGGQGVGGREPAPVALVREVCDGPSALFAAGVVTRRCAPGGFLGATGLLSTNALVGGREGVLVYALYSPWAAFVPRLRLRGGGSGPHPAVGALCAAGAVC